MGYARARSSWLDYPITTTLVRASDYNQWDQAIYELKNLAQNPLDYGAVGNGSDETTILAQVLATGKDVFLPQGYVFGTTGLSCSTAGQKIFGSGTLKLLSGGSLVGLSVSAAGVVIGGITLDQQNILNSVAVEFTGTAQRCAMLNNSFTNYKVAGIHLTGACSDLLIENNRYNGLGYGVLSADASTCSRINILGNDFVGGAYGDAVEINTPTGGASDISVVGNTISGYASSGPNDGIGIGFAHVQHGTIADNIVYNCALDGIHLEDGSSQVTISGNDVRSCGRSGIAVNSSNAARLSRDNIVSLNEVVDCGGVSGSAGIAFEGNQANQGLTATGNVVRGSGRVGGTCYGILVGGLTASNGAVTGNVVSNTLGATTAGIAFSNATDFAVTGNRCYDDQGTKTQQYGIQSLGSSDFLVVVGNNTRGNLTGTVSLVGAGNVNADNL